ncbi:dihydromonapterin reductase [Erwinia sp. HR93]|nr:dihydromonapterin reductase [Erwinia sp. HR93]MEA1065072.1 dihydromonapterin reductase [Erwinia sp. HR93]
MERSVFPVVITGAGRRIGLALAHHILARDLPLLISYRTRNAEIDNLEALDACCLQADFSQEASIEAFAAEVTHRCRGLRALIHNASTWQAEAPDKPLITTLEEMLRIHVHAPYLLNHRLAPLLCEQGVAGGDIIHLTDYVAERGSEKHIAYAASKAALDNMTRSFARKFAPYVKVNAIAPGLILPNEPADAASNQRAVSKSLMGVTPGVQEIIGLVDYLMASQFVTGRTFPVDGGRNLRS